MSSKKLFKTINKSLQHPSSLLPLTKNPITTKSPQNSPVPLPTVSLSLTSQEELLQFLRTYLKPPFTPRDLFVFFTKKLHYHPKFTQFDLHIFQWASKIDSFRHDHSTYEWMIRTLAVTDRFNGLHSVLEVMVSNPCPCSDGIFSCPRTEHIFRFAINSYCRVGRLDDALVAFTNMRKLIDGKPNVILYNILINGFVRFRKHEKALELYDKMIKDKVKPDVFTFNILISSYCRNSEFQLALDLFKEMKSKGCNPNVVSFNTLIKGFFMQRKIDAGIGMSYEMLDMGFDFSIVTCEILIDGVLKEGEVSKACDVLIDLMNKDAVPDGFDCLNVVERLCEKGELDRVLQLVDVLFVKGKSLNSIVCSTLIEALRNSGRIGEAVTFTKRMLKEGVVPDSVTFNCLLQAMCSLGRTTDANKLRILTSNKGLDPDGMTYNILVAGFSREGKRKEGEGLVDEMLDREFIPDLATYNRLMDGLCNGEKFIPHQNRIKGRSAKFRELCKLLLLLCVDFQSISNGFKEVINHGREEILNNMMNVAEEFFKMPATDKMEMYSDDPKQISKLHSSRDYENLKALFWRDSLTHPVNPPEEFRQLWPLKPSNYRLVAEAYSVAVRSLSLKLLELISEGLGIRSNYFHGDLTEVQLLTTNHYPQCPIPSLTLGLPEHHDPNTITILQQRDVPGLQVFIQGEWITVETIPNAFIVILGRQLQFVSNGRIQSVAHQAVTNSNCARTTLVTFITPTMDCTIVPAEELVDESNPQKYKIFKYKEFIEVHNAALDDNENVIKQFIL